MLNAARLEVPLRDQLCNKDVSLRSIIPFFTITLTAEGKKANGERKHLPSLPFSDIHYTCGKSQSPKENVFVIQTQYRSPSIQKATTATEKGANKKFEFRFSLE